MVGTGDFNIERFGYKQSHQIMREPQDPPSLEEMILAGESLTMEFKKSATSMKKILSTVTAFANTLGGTMVFGVDDIGCVVGLDCNVTEMMRGIAGNLRDCCIPTPPYRLYARTLGGPHHRRTGGRSVECPSMPRGFRRFVWHCVHPYGVFHRGGKAEEDVRSGFGRFRTPGGGVVRHEMHVPFRIPSGR